MSKTISTSMVKTSPAPDRVVHLIDGKRPFMLEHVLRDRPGDCVVRLGGEPRPGEHGIIRLPACSLVPGHADGGLRRYLDAGVGGAGSTLLHAWGTAAVAALGRLRHRTPFVASLDGFDPGHPLAREAATVVRGGRGAITATSRRLVATLNALSPGDGRGSCEEVICPVVPAVTLAPRSDLRRSSWGATDSTLVFGVISDPAMTSHLRDLAGIVVRCAMLRRHVVLVCSSRVGRRAEFLRWIESIGTTAEVVFDDELDRPADVVRSLDAALVPSILGHRWRCAAVEPVMTAVAAAIPTVLGDGHPAGEWRDEIDGLFTDATFAEHDAMKWILQRVDHPVGANPRLESHFQAGKDVIDRAYTRAGLRTSEKSLAAASR